MDGAVLTKWFGKIQAILLLYLTIKYATYDCKERG